ncbi:bacteriophage abortive infection AbiH family protein [Pseudomonas nitroreducens]|uniref:bacteriophage abortive infection AbiH family protein n=1 Tax=Pseudomonas nitroreducens TaxID=46680 RepID=UPI001F1DD31B|nr:bacteriophage abortive infection AbiH family protein [Pseudomonas nitroreducens]MCF6753098.1 bacteriophage abortive infection AbiH family protein [Stutzerimonas stutzeri]MDH1073351.1 bacteriophage abortive infection AbiH family protein [Pseudomonas nitroreducens]
MDTQTLYIIGNGFDLHHGLPTQYKHFKAFLNRVDRQVFNWVDTYVPADEDWSDLELALADMDTECVVSDLTGFLASYADENWSDAGHHDFQYEVDRVATGLSRTLQSRFGDWIRSIVIPDCSSTHKLLDTLNRNALYLNFNYTSTLSRLYDVQSENILHIHGEGAEPGSELILGHAWAPNERTSLQKGLDGESADHRVIEALGRLDDYFEQTFKPSEQIIKLNMDFFSNLRSVTHVKVLGHSLSEVDKAYFLAVVEALEGLPVIWTVAVRSHDEDTHKTLCLSAFGVPREQIYCKLWSEL